MSLNSFRKTLLMLLWAQKSYFTFTTDFLSWSLKIKCMMRGQGGVNRWCCRTEAAEIDTQFLIWILFINWRICAYLCQLHHHVGKDMKKANNSIPQPAVGQGLLVAIAWTLKGETVCYMHKKIKAVCKKAWIAPVLPGYIQLDCWKSVSPLPSLWRSFFCLAHQWHPSPSNTSRNHLLTPWVKHSRPNCENIFKV